MRYTEKSFSVPPPTLKDGRNSHGQTWEEIFKSDNSETATLPAEQQDQDLPR